MLLDLALWSLFAASCLLAAMALASVGTAVAGRWSLTRRLGGGAVRGSAVVFLLTAVALVIAFGQVANADVSSKATALGRSISEMMNCTALVLPTALIGAITSWLARRRLPKPTQAG